MTTTFGVIGATGKTGRRIADRLEGDGRAVRRLARGTAPAFDWTEPDGWAAALAGIDRLYVAFVPDLAAVGSDVVIAQLTEVARAAGVTRLVLLSGRGEDGARLAEDVVLASGIDSTIVRASWFSQNFTEGMLAGSVAEGYVAIPAGDRREPFVDVDDIADVAVEALVGEGTPAASSRSPAQNCWDSRMPQRSSARRAGIRWTTFRSRWRSFTRHSAPTSALRLPTCSPSCAARCSTAAMRASALGCRTRWVARRDPLPV